MHLQPQTDTAYTDALVGEPRSPECLCSCGGRIILPGLRSVRCLASGRAITCSGVGEGAVERVGEGGGECGGQQIDIELQISLRVEAVDRQGAAAAVGRNSSG